MLPLGDENPTRLRPIVTWTLIASCIVVFLWQSSSGASFFYYTLLQYGIIPVRVLGGRGLYSFITNIFLHGGWSHLLGNMLFLWVFGDNIEDHIACRSNSMFLGRLSYLGFYIVCGVTASAVWLVTAMRPGRIGMSSLRSASENTWLASLNSPRTPFLALSTWPQS